MQGAGQNTAVQVQNSPTVQYTGPNLYVKVTDETGKPVGGPLGDIVKDQTYKRLSEQGFQRVGSTADAHLVIYFHPGTRNHTTYVPGQTYETPVYVPGQSANVTAYDSRGNVVNATGNTSGSYQSKTQYREGYAQDVQDQWIIIEAWSQSFGSRPKQIFAGQVYRTNSSWEIFGNEEHLRAALAKLLEATSLGAVQRAPASIGEGKPGCRVMLGAKFDLSVMKAEKRFVVSSFVEGSAAEAAGTKIGDEVKSLAGVDYQDLAYDPERMDQLMKKNELKVAYLRDGKAKTMIIKPSLICPEL